MGPGQPGEAAAYFLWKNDHVAIIRLGDQGDPFQALKIRGSGQGHPHTVPGIGRVGDQIAGVSKTLLVSMALTSINHCWVAVKNRNHMFVHQAGS
jgi:hypothetical protein